MSHNISIFKLNKIVKKESNIEITKIAKMSYSNHRNNNHGNGYHKRKYDDTNERKYNDFFIFLSDIRLSL